MSERPTASTITDDQLDALWKALEQIEKLHSPIPVEEPSGEYVPTCPEDGEYTPCTTLRIIWRQRDLAMKENPGG